MTDLMQFMKNHRELPIELVAALVAVVAVFSVFAMISLGSWLATYVGFADDLKGLGTELRETK